MTTSPQSAITGPTYIVISRYSNGECYIDETKLGATLQDAIADIEHTNQVIMMEGGKVIDQSVEAAELWWAMNGHKCDTIFDVPQFIHDYIHNQVYDEIASSRYEANCCRQHEAGRTWGVS